MINCRKLYTIKMWDKKLKYGTKMFPRSIDMQNKIVAVEKLLPEAIELFKVRYALLQTIMQKGPIGRRSLTTHLALSERMIRGEVDKLAQNGLVAVTVQGIIITKPGEEVLNTLYLPLHYLEALTRQEEELKEKLGLKRVIILKGNLEQNEETQTSLGFAISSLLEEMLTAHTTIAITGGTTIANMVHYMPKSQQHYEDLHVLPARGSVGQRVELHANTIAVELANKLGGMYEILTIPDNLSHQSISLIKNEPQIEKLLQKLAKTDMIIFGIGNALKMAKHRKEPQEVLNLLEQKTAVAEAFRHYFNAEGQVVYASEVIGVAPDMAKKIPIRIAVAGGKSKAEAIVATRSLLQEGYLIVDEDAATAILNHLAVKG